MKSTTAPYAGIRLGPLPLHAPLSHPRPSQWLLPEQMSEIALIFLFSSLTSWLGFVVMTHSLENSLANLWYLWVMKAAQNCSSQSRDSAVSEMLIQPFVNQILFSFVIQFTIYKYLTFITNIFD